MKSVTYDKSFAFAVEIVKTAKELRLNREYELASQLIRSGVSIGANIAESEFAQSDADFVTKLSIALKEAAESRYWLKLLTATEDISDETSIKLLSQVDEIIRLLVASIKTKKSKL